MAISGRQPEEGKEELDADDDDLEPGGDGTEGIGEFLQSGRAGGVAFQGRDMGPDPPDKAAPGQL